MNLLTWRRSLVVLLACVSCTKNENTVSAPPPAALSVAPEGTTELGALASSDLQKVSLNTASLPQVSALSLDDLRFGIVGVAVGLQDFIASQAPTLSFQLPRDADYAEIMRCTNEVIISAGLNQVVLADVSISAMSEAEQASFYRRNDIFRGAAQNQGCLLVADALAQNTFVDLLAPSGDYRYILRACVNPARLTDSDKVSSRNCSLRVAVSSPLKGYVNARLEAQQKNLRLAQSAAGKLDQASIQMRQLASDANNSLDYCENVEHTRKVNKAVRDSWVTLTAAVVDSTVAIKTLQLEPGQAGAVAVYRYFTSVFSTKGGFKVGVFNDILQQVGSAQGFICSAALKQLASSSEDSERSCARYKGFTDQAQVVLEDLATAGISYQYYLLLAKGMAPASTGTP